jgi:hypothetical protein
MFNSRKSHISINLSFAPIQYSIKRVLKYFCEEKKMEKLDMVPVLKVRREGGVWRIVDPVCVKESEKKKRQKEDKPQNTNGKRNLITDAQADKFKVSSSAWGKTRIVDDKNYVYRSKNVANQRRYWRCIRCTNRKDPCLATLVTASTEPFRPISSAGKHGHLPDHCDLQTRQTADRSFLPKLPEPPLGVKKGCLAGPGNMTRRSQRLRAKDEKLPPLPKLSKRT